MRSDGSHLRKLASSDAAAFGAAPSFSPDGRRVAFAAAPGVVSVRARDVRGRRVLFRSGKDILFSSWSVRDVLAVAEDCRGLVGLWRASTRRVKPRKLVSGGCYDAVFLSHYTWYPNWSPDGQRLAYMRRTWWGDPPTAIADRILVKRLHHRSRRFTHGPSDIAPVWSPDGRSLAFTRVRLFYSPYSSDIRVARLGRRSRSTGVTGQLADWQPLPRRRHR